jgi:hypothetical protein
VIFVQTVSGESRGDAHGRWRNGSARRWGGRRAIFAGLAGRDDGQGRPARLTLLVTGLSWRLVGNTIQLPSPFQLFLRIEQSLRRSVFDSHAHAQTSPCDNNNQEVITLLVSWKLYASYTGTSMSSFRGNHSITGSKITKLERLIH